MKLSEMIEMVAYDRFSYYKDRLIWLAIERENQIKELEKENEELKKMLRKRGII